MSSPAALVIGGGISGLSTAWWLAEKGHCVEVWEADNQVGGLIRSHKEQGFLTERAASMVVNFRPQVDTLLCQSGLYEKRLMRNEDLKRYILHNDELKHVPMRLLPLLKSDIWSSAAKLRLGLEVFAKRGQPDETVTEFITRRLGREVLDTVMEPFVSATLASDPDKAEARSILPRLTALERRYGSLSVGMFVNRIIKKRRANQADNFSFTGGMSTLINALSSHPRVTVRCGVSVSNIEKRKNSWAVSANTDSGERRFETDQLVITTPAQVASHLVSDFDKPLADHLSEINYTPVAVMHIGVRDSAITHPLDGTGFLVSRQSNKAFNGNLWMSQLFQGRAPEGYKLLSTYLGGAYRPEQVGWSDDRLIDTTLGGLRDVLGLRKAPEYIRIDRQPLGLPQYHGQYHARLHCIDSCMDAHKGLYLSANYSGGVSVRERIYQASLTANKVSRAITDRHRVDEPDATLIWS